MKRLLILLLTIFVIGHLFADALDPYNVVILNRATSSKYGSINTQLQSCFESKGFKVYLNQSWSDVPKNEWDRALSVGWEVNPGYGIPTTVKVELYNSLGQKIATYVETGNSFSIGADVSIAVGKITRVIRNTPYHYKEIDVDQTKFPPIKMSEDSVKRYLTNNNIREIEGIYKTFGDNWYRFAVIKQEGKFAAFILDAENVRFKQGDIKAYFEPVKRNLYATTYIMGDKTTKEVLATIEDDVLTIALGGDNTLTALRIFPNGDTGGNITAAPEGNEKWVASGSGFFVSDRIIATNNHVIKDANSIKIVVKDGTEVKSYTARVLITDKTNDLALVSITDKDFSGAQTIPYKLFLDTKEVGTSIFTMGYPMSNILGSEIKITDGIISSKTGFQGDIVTYQITAPIQPGNSGGALFDKNGVLVGVTNAGVRSAENVGYAIKTVYLKNLIEAAPVYIEMPTGTDLSGKDLPELVKILSPYIVFVEVF